MTWALDHLGDILFRAGQHAWLAGLPLVLGLVIALPLGWLANRTSWLRATLLTTTGLLYTIPSLALFILLPSILGTKILDPVNVIVAMTIYTVALLTRTVADGLSSVDPSTRQAAIAMGYGGFARFRAVDLPLAVPVIAAGLRVAAVSNVSIVSVASLIGISQLGYFLTDGYARSFPTEVWVGSSRACSSRSSSTSSSRSCRVCSRRGRGRWPHEPRDAPGLVQRPRQLAGHRRIPSRVTEHLLYTAITLLIALVIAVPLGAWVGHTGRLRWLVTGANARARCRPRAALRRLESSGRSSRASLAFVIPSIAVLVLLAVPPLLSGAYAGIESVEPAARDAARGMGMTGGQVLTRVELPGAMPLFLSGFRSATLQVIATATIAASVSLGGLGRYLIDGLASRDYVQMVAARSSSPPSPSWPISSSPVSRGMPSRRESPGAPRVLPTAPAPWVTARVEPDRCDPEISTASPRS